MDIAQRSELGVFFGDFRQGKKLSEIKPSEKKISGISKNYRHRHTTLPQHGTLLQMCVFSHKFKKD